ncbi:MAG: hypothetical protein V4608_13210 [Bacteroidota bacterium]
MLYNEFYAELGKLLYAVADIDGVITQKEKEELQMIVHNELVPVEKHVDNFGTDTAFYTEMEFDYLDEQVSDAQAAFESFINFVEDHHTAFNKNLKNACLHLVAELANAYKGTNKKEKILIDKLKHQLENISYKK